MIATRAADVMVELSPTNLDSGEPATSHITAALNRGLHVVTANKGPAALHLKPVTIKVVVREAQGQYQASNNIKGYESAGGVRAPAPAFVAQAEEAPAAKPSAPAWARK